MLDIEIRELQELKDIASQRAKDIRTVVENLSKDEYEKVGPALNVNMLAFMDSLKYQMSSKATMEQLFFITCDDRISKLLKYKLSGRGIELRELLETDLE